MNIRRALLAGVAAGLLVALSIPPFGWWPLSWIGMAVLFATLPGLGRRERAALGAGFGLGDYVLGLFWVQEFSVPGYIGLVLISGVYAVLGMLIVPTRRRPVAALGLTTAMVLAEWARDRFPFGGLPLGGIPLGQAAGPLAPVLRLGGSLLLTAETVLAGVVLAEMWRLARTRERDLSIAAPVLAVAVLLPLIGSISPSGAGGGLAPIRVALVQGGGARGTRAVHSDPELVFRRHIDAAASLRPPLDLVLLPEGVMQTRVPFAANPDSAALSRLAKRLRSTVVAGVDQDLSTTQYHNEVVAWNAGGQPAGTYVKNHLVPFGEYIPYRSLVASLFNVKDVPFDGVPGHGPGYLETPAARLAVMISFEVFFDERARGGVRAGGELLVVPTNTASYRSTQVPTQEVAADKIRAWETGRWLIQVTPTGYSNVVTDTGRVVMNTHLDHRADVVATVPRRTGWTVYDHLGDLAVFLLALVGWVAALVWSRRISRTGPGTPRLPPTAG